MQTRLEQLQGLSQAELIAKLMEAEKGRKPGTISLKVAEKGGLSLYGVQRFPVTLYAESWVRLLNEADRIREFIKANADKGLTFKAGIPEMGIQASAKAE